MDSGTYSRWAGLLLSHRFNYAAFIAEATFVVPPTLYLGWITIVALAKVAAGASWPYAIVALNWAAVVATCWMVLSEARRLGGSPIVAGLLFLASFDLLLFVRYALSDMLPVALTTAIVVAALRRKVVSGTILVAIACVFRPTAAPLVAFWIFALVWPRLAPRRKRVAVAPIAVAIVGGIVVHARLMQSVTDQGCSRN